MRVKDSIDADEISDAWIVGAERLEQIEAMRDWFLARFEDPSVEQPYDSENDEYLYPSGGPYDAYDVLNDRFGPFVDVEVLQELVDDLNSGVGDEWAPRHPEPDYGEDFSTEVEDRDQPLKRLKDRLDEILGTFELVGNYKSQQLLIQLSHGAAISALEVYLSDTVTYWLGEDEDAFRMFVVTNKDFSARKFELGQIFERFDGLKTEVKVYWETFIWHRLDKVREIVEPALDIRFPDIGLLMREVVKRHDVIHRGGRTKDGEPIIFRQQDVKATVAQVSDFSSRIETSLQERFPRPIWNADFSDEEVPF